MLIWLLYMVPITPNTLLHSTKDKRKGNTSSWVFSLLANLFYHSLVRKVVLNVLEVLPSSCSDRMGQIYFCLIKLRLYCRYFLVNFAKYLQNRLAYNIYGRQLLFFSCSGGAIEYLNPFQKQPFRLKVLL